MAHKRPSLLTGRRALSVAALAAVIAAAGLLAGSFGLRQAERSAAAVLPVVSAPEAGGVPPSPTPTISLAPTPTPIPYCPDIDGDGAVTASDIWLQRTWKAFNVPPAPPGADPDQDGWIGFSDLVALAAFFGSKSCTADEPSGPGGTPAPATPGPAPGMSLDLAGLGATCGGTEPAKCYVLPGTAFTVSVETKLAAGGGYMGFQTQLFYSALDYEPSGSEAVWPDASGFIYRAPYSPTGMESVTRRGDTRSFGWQEPSTHEGAVFELAFTCTESGSHTVALPVRTGANLQGSAYILGGSSEYVAAVTARTVSIDLDGDTSVELVPVADSITVICSGTPTPTPTLTDTPTPTLTQTPTPTNTPTPTITLTPTPKQPGGDTDGDTIANGSDPDDDNDGCADVQELGANEALGGLRNPHSFWDFYDVWTHPAGQPLLWERNSVVNIFDILAVALRFGPGPQLSKQDAFAAALTPPVDDAGYHAGYDRGPIIGANTWDRAPPDASINIVDDILGVAAQFGHDCA